MKQASSAIGFASGNSSIIRFGAILLVMGLSELASANTGDNHWAFREISNPTPPTVSGAANPVDSFFGIPEEKASRRNLLRRAHLDLVGLPPSYEEIEQFSKDSRPDEPHLRDRSTQRWSPARTWEDVDGPERCRRRRPLL